MSKVPTLTTHTEILSTTQQVDRTLQSVIVAAQSLIAADPKHFANLQASFLALYTHPTFQLILDIPIQIPSSTTPPFNQFHDELWAIKNSV